MKAISRKQFLSATLLGSTGVLIGATSFPQTTTKPKLDPIAPALVKEFVSVSHRDVNKVKEMLKDQPGLLNCMWDLGGGDFESGLEAAGHVGNRDIALFLIDNGARMNIFCAAMLGRIEIVKSILTAFPELKNSKGPHGLQLIHHAKKGGEEAKEVLEYLQSIGAK